MALLFAAAMVVGTGGAALPSSSYVSGGHEPATEEAIVRAIEGCRPNRFYMYEPDHEIPAPTGEELGTLPVAEAIRRVRTGAKLEADAPARELLLAWLQECLGPFGPDAIYEKSVVGWKETSERLFRADQLAPDNTLVATIAGRYIYKMHPDGDEVTLQRLAAIKPAAVGQLWLAHYLTFSDEKKALPAYQRSLSLQPSNDVRLQYAAALVRTKNWKEALAQLELLPASFEPRRSGFWRARALTGLKRFEEARKALAALVPNPPPDPTQDRSWSQVFSELGYVEGDLACARAEVEQGLKDYPEAERWLRSSWCGSALAKLFYEEKRWFDALLASSAGGGGLEERSMQLDIYLRLGASGKAISYLTGLSDRCHTERGKRDLAPEVCQWAETRLADLRSSEPRLDEEKAWPGLMARLAAPRIPLAQESPFPDEALGKVPLRKVVPKQLASAPVPKGGIIFAANDGQRIVVVSLSRDLDPTGELSRGGYWISLSDDAGKTWRGPFYTGLTEGFPYTIKERSRLPLFSRDRIQLEASLREIDEESISFPPLGLKTKRSMDNLALTISLPSLQADSDGDGLTDLYEEKIGSDPSRADTDGDGLDDRHDPLPLTPTSAPSLADDELVARALKGLLSQDWMARVVVPDAKDLSSIVGKNVPTPATSGGVLFIESEWPRFVGLPLEQRLIVLPPDAVRAYRKKFGPAFYPVHIDELIWNEDHTRAFFEYSFGWRGGSFLIENAGSDWKVRPLGNWTS